MEFNYSVLDDTEKIIFALRSLYMSRGFRLYRMGKFEEYDLYSRNKDFLVSDTVITFMDTNGRLMALRPDVTLSIIKNNRDLPNTLQKLCYNEYVYRVSKGDNCFREIMQTGLECFGAVDCKCISEVLQLSIDSLRAVCNDYALLVSNLDILSCFINELTDNPEIKASLIKSVNEKNLHAINSICRDNALNSGAANRLEKLLSLKGNMSYVISETQKICAGTQSENAFAELSEVLSFFKSSPDSDKIQIDFSVTGDMNYYNGIIFKGYISGVPGNVLSGGQYDRLMKKMGRKSNAVGFAVYLDLLERISIESMGEN